MIYRTSNLFGVERHRKSAYEFKFSWMCYEADACSVGRLPESELVAEGAIRMITEGNLRNLYILDLACGIGIIELKIFSRLGYDSTIKGIAFSERWSHRSRGAPPSAETARSPAIPSSVRV